MLKTKRGVEVARALAGGGTSVRMVGAGGVILAELDDGSRRLEEIRRLIAEGPKLTPEQILDRISDIEGRNSTEERKFKPTFSGTEGSDLHTHQLPDEVKRGEDFRFGEEEAKRFWNQFAKTPLQDIAVLTHSNIRTRVVGDDGREFEFNADTAYETLMKHKPANLTDKHLWRGMEVKTYSETAGKDRERLYTGEIGILSLDPSKRIDPWFYEQHTVAEVCDRVKTDPNLAAFVPHPNAPDGIATGIAREEAARLMREEGLSKGDAERRVKDSKFGERETARIMGEYGFGTEYHGFYKETLDAAETGHVLLSSTPVVGGAIGKITGKAVKIIGRMYDTTDYEQSAAFKSVGSDAHKTEHVGNSYLIVKAPEKKLGEGESLGKVYEATELSSGLVILTPRDELRNRALIDALKDPDTEKIAVLSEQPAEKTWGDFLGRLERLLRERFEGQVPEARLTELGRGQREEAV